METHMIDIYPLDKDRLLFFVIVNAALFIYILYNQKKIIDLAKYPVKFRRGIIAVFIVGILTLIISSILVATSFQKWDFNLIKAFLIFGNIG
jgi:hypothetical protein